MRLSLACLPILIDLAAIHLLVAIALVQVEVVQVVSHSTVVELFFSHGSCFTAVTTGGRHTSGCRGIIQVGVAITEVRVHHLVAIRISRITKDSIRLRSQRCFAGSLHPAALHVTLLGNTSFCIKIGNTSSIERTPHTEIIDITTEVPEQRIIQTADGMTVTMQGALEADIISTDRCPTVWMIDIRT